MRMIVCVKQVPDTAEITIDRESNCLVREGAAAIVNPFDASALEAAVRLKELCGGTVTALSMGPEQAKSALRSCIAAGADRGVLISGKAFAGSDTLATSYILSKAIRKLEAEEGPYDLVLCGRQAIDGDTAQVGPELAVHLGLPLITYVSFLPNIQDGHITAVRDLQETYETVACPLPALVTVLREGFPPRCPTLRNNLSAKRAVILVLTASDLPEADQTCAGLSGSPTRVIKTFVPEMEKKERVVRKDDEEEAGRWLARVLKAGRLKSFL